jgi:hypothetical protein
VLQKNSALKREGRKMIKKIRQCAENEGTVERLEYRRNLTNPKQQGQTEQTKNVTERWFEGEER